MQFVEQIIYARIAWKFRGSSASATRFNAQTERHVLGNYGATDQFFLHTVRQPSLPTSASRTPVPALKLHSRHLLFIAIAALLLLFTRFGERRWGADTPVDDLPRLMLWAWERPVNIPSLDTTTTGVAYYAGSIYVTPDSVEPCKRVNTLSVPRGTRLLPVVRIESGGTAGSSLSKLQVQAHAVAGMLRDVVQSDAHHAIQIDYDATLSERPFYSQVIRELRHMTGTSAHIEITALASWCVSDPWIDSLPVDAAVPMLFRMGKEQAEIMQAFSTGKGLRSRLAAGLLGVSLDEPMPLDAASRRLYVFNPGPWSEPALHHVIGNPHLLSQQ